ncbi:MAG: FAD:protein FMN transferase [Clostridia bacterium]|nr:FAD:protein FMN transferase [Clostridia bacterium]
MKRLFAIIICVVLLINLSSCASVNLNGNEKEATKTITAMNTVMQITVFNTSEGTNEDVLNAMVMRIEELEKLFDPDLPESDVYKINNAEYASGNDAATKTKKVVLSRDTLNVLSSAISNYRVTGYAFDIKLMPVIELWGFDDGNYGVPKTEEISEALCVVEKSEIEINSDEGYVLVTEGTRVSLGGIAKGYLGDELLKIAREYGATALLSLGGNIVLCGDKGDGDLWSVGIKNPKDAESIACSFKSAGNKSVVTSGAYERYFKYGGKTYHHIIDPKTGCPSQSDVLSVTVIGENGANCDALSTALFVMGKEKAVAFAKENNSYDFILITKNNEIYITEGVGKINLEDESFKVKSIPR